MPIIKFVNESEKIEYSTEQDVCSLLCYVFDPQKTIMNDNQFVGCKPFGFPFWYMRNPLAVHQFMEFNHKRQFKHWKDLAKHRVISFSKEENPLVATLKIIGLRTEQNLLLHFWTSGTPNRTPPYLLLSEPGRASATLGER